jgi:hypothetical protein
MMKHGDKKNTKYYAQQLSNDAIMRRLFPSKEPRKRPRACVAVPQNLGAGYLLFWVQNMMFSFTERA